MASVPVLVHGVNGLPGDSASLPGDMGNGDGRCLGVDGPSGPCTWLGPPKGEEGGDGSDLCGVEGMDLAGVDLAGVATLFTGVDLRPSRICEGGVDGVAVWTVGDRAGGDKGDDTVFAGDSFRGDFEMFSGAMPRADTEES